MKKKIIFSFLVMVIISLSYFFLIPSLQAQSASADPTTAGLEETKTKVTAFNTQNIDAKNFLSTKAGQIIGVVLSFIDVLFLILMIFAGLTWMTAQGNEQKISKAKTLIVDAIISIIIVLAAYDFTLFLGNELL